MSQGNATSPRKERPRVITVPLRAHPHLIQINTWAWLVELSRDGQALTLADVPDAEWERLRAHGFDIVYLLGVWKRSAAGRRIARTDPAAFRVFDAALPGWTLESVVGSPFSIQAYAPDPRIGSWRDLDAVRAKLNARGMRLVLDFISNHTGPDHPWVRQHPEYFIQGLEADYRRDPTAFHYLDAGGAPARFIARGRDPYFPPWSDTAQIDHFNPSARAALIETLRTISQHCDGVRCDMAMLALNDVFVRTWGPLLRDRPWPRDEFWVEAIASVPSHFVWIAEVYWDMEARLHALGFHYTYDKRLYDFLLQPDVQRLQAHLAGEPAVQARMARFLENHDERRSVAAFGRQRIPGLATLLMTLPGLRFLHAGQLEGRSVHLPMPLDQAMPEPPDTELERCYERILRMADAPAFHDGEWKLLDVTADNDDTYRNLIAYRWRAASEYRLIVVNCAGAACQGRLNIGDDAQDSVRYQLTDLVDGTIYLRDRDDLRAHGLYVRLPEYGAHCFHVEPAR